MSSWPLDGAVLRQAGALLVQRTTFERDHALALVQSTMDDGQLTLGEIVSLLAVYLAVNSRCDEGARAVFEDFASTVRASTADPEAWVVQTFSREVLSKAAEILAGRGDRLVDRLEVQALVGVAFADQHISEPEGNAILLARVMCDGRLTRQATEVFAKVAEALARDPVAPSPPPPKRSTGTRQCGSCAGTGTVTCRSCGGTGSHRHNRTRWSGNRQEHYVENLPCRCSGGRVSCGTCGGSGRV